MNSERIRGKVFWPDGHFSGGEVEIRAGRIAGVRSLPEEALQGDERTALILPGLVDIHSHACIGYDTCEADEEQLGKMLDFQRSVGVTSYLPTTMTYDEGKLGGVCRRIAAVRHPGLKGIYLEGPFLSREKKGAQNPEYIMNPDIDMFRRLQKEANGLFKLCDIAPELDGALEFIDELKDEVRISVAHTCANYDEAKAAFDHGATQVTHLYNAMNPLTHRAPGVIGAASENENVYAEMICDGVHIHQSAIRAAFKLFGDDRIILISDSMMATGKPDGQYSLGGQDVTVKGAYATLTEGGNLAGSVTNLMNCVRYVVKTAGISLGSAIKCAAVNSAKSVGIYDNYGSITVGKLANLVLLDENLDITRIIKRGTVVR